MTIRSDQRTIETDPSPELHLAAKRARSVALEHELRLADLFAGILESREYVEQGAASLVEYARRLGHHGARAIVQARLGQAIRLRPQLAEQLRGRVISIENAETIAAVVADPMTRDVEDWLGLAEQCELGALREVVRLRREEARRGDGKILKSLPVLLTDEEMAKVRRVREIASHRARRQLTESEGIVTAVDEYLERRDPEQQAKRARSVPPKTKPPAEGTVGEPDTDERGRYIPKAVDWKVRERARHRCEVPGCIATTGLELCHRLMWSRGGEHHPDNLVLLCHRHHVMLDAGRIACLGFAGCGRPIFRLPDGALLLPKPTGPPE